MKLSRQLLGLNYMSQICELTIWEHMFLLIWFCYLWGRKMAIWNVPTLI